MKWERVFDGAVNVTWFGARGDNSDNDTVAFSLSAKNAPAANNIVGAEGLLPRAPMCLVHVPAGNYTLSSLVDTGGREVTWQIDQAALITGFKYLNGTVMRLGIRQNDAQHGSTDYACNLSLRSNSSLEDGAEVLGIQNASQLSTYVDRDTVGLYVDNTAPAATYETETATFTALTVTVLAPPTNVLLKYRAGMVIDTKHTSKWSGIVSSWNVDGSVITVTGWYQVGGTPGTPGTPPNGTGIVLNGFTKVWAQNSNVMLNPSSYAKGATGFELGLLNTKGDSSTNYSVQTNRCWGFDSVNLGTYIGQAAFIARGRWHYGFYAVGQGTGFTCEGTASTKAVSARNPSGAEFYSIDCTGNTVLGCSSVVGTPYIDFQSSGSTYDYDSRIIASGGTSTRGQGTLKFDSGTSRFSGDVIPDANNTKTLGSVDYNWSNVYAIQSTAHVFNAKLSLNIGSPTSASTPYIDFHSSENAVDHDARLYAAGGSETVGSGNLYVSCAKFAPNDDNLTPLGSGSTRWSTIYAGTGAINTSDAREKQDIEVLDAAEKRVALAIKGMLKKFRFKDSVAEKGADARIHVGVIAQEVEAAFASEGLDAAKYALLCYDEWDAEFDDEGVQTLAAGSRYGVRYEELLAFIIGAM